MQAAEVTRTLGEISSSQWGLLTTAQAAAHGVTRLQLSRLTEAGELVRVAQGIYRDAGAPSDRLEDLRAAWLSTDPGRLAEDRIQSNDVAVVTGESAASLHQIGDFLADVHEFSLPGRRQTQRSDVRFRRREYPSDEITIVEGLPTTSPERTIADLVERRTDLSLVADALADGLRQSKINAETLAAMLAPYAARNGFAINDGQQLLDELLSIARLDLASISERIAAIPQVWDRVVADSLAAAYTRVMPQADLRPILDRFLQTWTPPQSMAAALQNAIHTDIDVLETIRRSIPNNKTGSTEHLASTIRILTAAARDIDTHRLGTEQSKYESTAEPEERP